jgi:hypothetical protein
VGASSSLELGALGMVFALMLKRRRWDRP